MTKSAAKVSKEDSRRPPCKPPCGVHELVARAMRGEYVRHGAEQKSEVLPLLVISNIPRVRTYHTRKPSRFVHALPARPLKVHGGRGCDMCVNRIKRYALFAPHPSACGCHLLPLSRRRRPNLLRKSVNSPLEKAGEMSNFSQAKYTLTNLIVFRQMAKYKNV